MAVTSYQRRRSVGDVEGFTLAWGILACYGVFLWLVYNQVIFGDMMYFSSGPGAATSYAGLAEADGLLPTKYDPYASASIFGWAVIDNLGLPLVIAGIAGGVLIDGQPGSASSKARDDTTPFDSRLPCSIPDYRPIGNVEPSTRLQTISTTRAMVS